MSRSLSQQAPLSRFLGTPQATGALSPASWVTITPSAFELAPGQHLAVQVRIAVPSAPEPGEHQVGVVFLVPAGRSGQNVAINRGIGTQLLISVPGPIVDRIALAKLAAPGLVDGGPATFTVTVHNRGTIHHDFVHPGQLVARVHGDSVKFPDFTVLRGSTRVVSTQWQHPPLVCLCRVVLAADDGQGHQIVLSRQVIVFPLRFSAGLLLLALGLALVQRRRRAGRRPDPGLRERPPAHRRGRHRGAGGRGSHATETLGGELTG